MGWLGLSLGPPRLREPFLLLVYISHNLNHLSAYHVTSSRMSLGLRVYSSPLFFDPVSLLMAYQHANDLFIRLLASCSL